MSATRQDGRSLRARAQVRSSGGAGPGEEFDGNSGDDAQRSLLLSLGRRSRRPGGVAASEHVAPGQPQRKAKFRSTRTDRRIGVRDAWKLEREVVRHQV